MAFEPVINNLHMAGLSHTFAETSAAFMEAARPFYHRTVAFVGNCQGHIAKAAPAKLSAPVLSFLSRTAVTTPWGPLSAATLLSSASLFIAPVISVTSGIISRNIRSVLQTRTNDQVLLKVAHSDTTNEKTTLLFSRRETLAERAAQYRSQGTAKASWSRKLSYLLTAAAPVVLLPQIGLGVLGLSALATAGLFLEGRINAWRNNAMANTCQQQSDKFDSAMRAEEFNEAVPRQLKAQQEECARLRSENKENNKENKELAEKMVRMEKQYEKRLKKLEFKRKDEITILQQEIAYLVFEYSYQVADKEKQVIKLQQKIDELNPGGVNTQATAENTAEDIADDSDDDQFFDAPEAEEVPVSVETSKSVETPEPVETPEAPETAEASETAEAPETAEASETAETQETAEKSEPAKTPETETQEEETLNVEEILEPAQKTSLITKPLFLAEGVVKFVSSYIYR